MCDCAKCECGVNAKLQKYTEEQRLIQFLMRLNGSYTAVRGNILMMAPFPSISKAYSLPVKEERQRQVKVEVSFLGENASLSVGTNKSLNSYKRNEGKRPQLFCDHCKRTGHTIEKCYKLYGYPSRPVGRGRGANHQGQNTTAYNTWTESDNQEAVSDPQVPLMPSLNAEQSKQLF